MAELPPEAPPVEEDKDAALLERAQMVMTRIMEQEANPNPKLLHTLATMLDRLHDKHIQEAASGVQSSAATKPFHVAGKLADLLQDNEEFCDMVFSKFLSESAYTSSVQAAAARLLVTCSSAWKYPHSFDNTVLDNIKNWVMGDAKVTDKELCWKYLGKNKATDAQMLKTYSVAMVSIALESGGVVLEDFLNAGVSAKLMQHLRIRVLGESNNCQEDANMLLDTRHSHASKGKDDNKNKTRSTVDGLRADCPSIENAYFHNLSVGRIDITSDNTDIAEGMQDEIPLDDLSRKRLSRGGSRSRGKGVANEGIVGNELALTASFSRPSQSIRDKLLKNEDVMKINNSKKNYYGSILGEDGADCLGECIVGSKDISGIVLKAVRAAESEAREENAPADAIKAAGDAAAELVKSAAFEAWKSKNDDTEAVIAAEKAARTVVDAAMSTLVSRGSAQAIKESLDSITMSSVDEDLEDFVIVDEASLLHLMDKYCIQCLQVLGEYVEALGPVLHERGVDVCLTMLQRCIDSPAYSEYLDLLPEVLKLICALAAHKKFAALFVDRGGVHKILSLPRNLQTFLGISSCLFTLGSLQGIMERVCALPYDTVHKVVELAFELYECPQDHARKNIAIFFATTFVFRAILDSFDNQDGLEKILSVLRGAASKARSSNSEGFTPMERQIAYHSCVALRQYFRSHLQLLVDSLRPVKSTRSVARNPSTSRVAYKPLDISDEAMDAVFLQIQRDRKLGPAFAKAKWPVLDKFLWPGPNLVGGHITLLELCQSPSNDRYLHDLVQYAFGVLQIVTLVSYSRKFVVNAQLSNNGIGMAVILERASSNGFVEPEEIHPALNVLVNLVCPPPSICNKPSSTAQNPQPASMQSSEIKERNSERSCSDRVIPMSIQNESRERGVDCGAAERGTVTNFVSSGVVGDRRVSLGPGTGCASLAFQLEQGYRQAREAVRSNNGIKILLHLLNPRMITPPVALDSIRALACRVLLGLSRDDAIAHILSKLQVGKKLSELIRESGNQTSGSVQNRWQAELTQVAIELISVLTNSGKESTMAATDAAAPALKRIERAAIAAATPISYHSRELLQLIHEHLQASGLKATASLLLKEANLKPLPSSGTLLGQLQASADATSVASLQWPSGRVSSLLQDARNNDAALKSDSRSTSLKKKKPLVFSSCSSQSKAQNLCSPFVGKMSMVPKSPLSSGMETNFSAAQIESEALTKTPILLPMKRKISELKDQSSATPAKRHATTELGFQTPLFHTYNLSRRSVDTSGPSPTVRFSSRSTVNNPPGDSMEEAQNSPGVSTPYTPLSSSIDQQSGYAERMTLDSLVVQYLKHQHRQCPTPVTTLPPLSLLHPHICSEPSRILCAPTNVTARICSREIRKQFSGIQIPRRDRQFIYSRFKSYRVCRDDVTTMTCLTFLGDPSRIATGYSSGEMKIFSCETANILDTQMCHDSEVVRLEYASPGETHMILSSGHRSAKLWNASSLSSGPLHTFEDCRLARFSNSANAVACLSTEASGREILLYDVQTCSLDLRLEDSLSVQSAANRVQSLVHFSPSDLLLLWNGALWDRRSPDIVHRFDQFTDYGGGGFHPGGNEVIVNSEVWDLRKFKLLRSVPSLDQTTITFNSTGDVIYAILRRNLDDVTLATHGRRPRHPLYPAFRTIDALTYSDIATVQIDRCVLDFAAEPTNSLVGVVAMDDPNELFSSARLFEVGRKRPTDDDSDAEDNGDTDDDEDDDDNDEYSADILLSSDLIERDSDSDDSNNEEDDENIDSGEDNDEDGLFEMEAESDGEGGVQLALMGEGDGDDEDDSDLDGSFESDGDLTGNGYGY